METILDYIGRRPHAITSAVAAVILLAALGNWSDGYYQLTRWVVCAASVFVAYKSRTYKQTWGICLFTALAVLFNPLVPFHMAPESWQMMDVLAAGCFIASVAIHSPLSRHEIREAARLMVVGRDAFEKGRKIWLEGCQQSGMEQAEKRRLDEEALRCFDEAIECGFKEEGIYALRGISLQALGFHLDAIDDLTKAIALEPTDSNLYHVRSVSKHAVRDLDGQLSDLQEAIRVVQRDPVANISHECHANETGWGSITAYYEAQVASAKLDLDFEAARQKRHDRVDAPEATLYRSYPRRRLRPRPTDK